MSYTHLTISERSKIETYLELGYSIRAIAKKTKRHPDCTVDEAQARYQANKSNCCD